MVWMLKPIKEVYSSTVLLQRHVLHGIMLLIKLRHWKKRRRSVRQGQKSFVNYWRLIHTVKCFSFECRLLLLKWKYICGMCFLVKLSRSIITKAYKKLSLKAHPDKGGDPTSFNMVMPFCHLYLVLRSAIDYYCIHLYGFLSSLSSSRLTSHTTRCWWYKPWKTSEKTAISSTSKWISAKD